MRGRTHQETAELHVDTVGVTPLAWIRTISDRQRAERLAEGDDCRVRLADVRGFVPEVQIERQDQLLSLPRGVCGPSSPPRSVRAGLQAEQEKNLAASSGVTQRMNTTPQEQVTVSM